MLLPPDFLLDFPDFTVEDVKSFGDGLNIEHLSSSFMTQPALRLKLVSFGFSEFNWSLIQITT